MHTLISIATLAAAAAAFVCGLLLLRGRSAAGTPDPRILALADQFEALRRQLQDEIKNLRAESADQARMGREEMGGSMQRTTDQLLARVVEMSTLQKNQLDSFTASLGGQLGGLTRTTEERLEKLRETIAESLKAMRTEAGTQLEQMRLTVDEKLQTTLERRMSESFKLVSERLEQVHKGLGEMQGIAAGVGDLKRVLTNVKTRGIWGEIQLSALLDDMLTADQYEANFAPDPATRDRVEFAVRLPGKGENPVYLPIDAKFPQEDYQRLLQAQEAGDLEGAEQAAAALEKLLRAEAKTIRSKYIRPPLTTDFAILFLPTEGLYAEMLRRPGLIQGLQHDCSVLLAGPSTLSAMLCSLRMGFKTLAIERRSAEVWDLLSLVKAEFTKFGDILVRTHKKLDEAQKTLDEATSKTNTIQKRLDRVQSLPAPQGQPEDAPPAPPLL